MDCQSSSTLYIFWDNVIYRSNCFLFSVCVSQVSKGNKINGENTDSLTWVSWILSFFHPSLIMLFCELFLSSFCLSSSSSCVLMDTAVLKHLHRPTVIPHQYLQSWNIALLYISNAPQGSCWLSTGITKHNIISTYKFNTHCTPH